MKIKGYILIGECGQRFDFLRVQKKWLWKMEKYDVIYSYFIYYGVWKQRKSYLQIDKILHNILYSLT